MENSHSYSRIIETTVEGRRSENFLLAVPLNGDSTNILLALSFLERLKNSFGSDNGPPPLTIKVLFLGAEYGDTGIPHSGPSYPMGSREFLRTFTSEDMSICFYLGFTHLPKRVLIRPGANGEVSPHWLIQRTSSAIEKSGLFSLVLGNEIQLYRLGLSDSSPPSAVYLRENYPSLFFESSSSSLEDGELQNWVTRFTDFLFSFLQENKSGFKEEWDRHYLFFQARGFSLIIPEGIYVALFLGALGFLLAYAIVFRHKLMKYFRSILRHIWALPMFYLFIFFFLLLAGGVLVLLSQVKGYPQLWRELPLLFFSLKILLSLFLVFLSFRFLKHLPIPLQGHFYSASAILLLLINIGIMAVYNFSLTYYFVWAFLFTFLFSLSRKKSLKLIFFLLSPIWLVKAGLDILTLPSLRAIEQIITVDVQGNLLLSAVVLPFVLMIVRLDFIFRHLLRSRRWIIISFIFIVLGSGSVGTLIYTLTYDPWRKKPQPISATDSIDISNRTRSLTINSSAHIGTLEVFGKGYAEIINTDNTNTTLTSSTIIDTTTVDYTWDNFLNRKTITVHITFQGDPTKVLFSIHSNEDIILYDTDFPSTLYPTENSAALHIGRNPPNPLNVTFTVPEELTLELDLEVYYETLPYPLTIEGENITLRKTGLLKKTLVLNTDAEGKEEEEE